MRSILQTLAVSGFELFASCGDSRPPLQGGSAPGMVTGNGSGNGGSGGGGGSGGSGGGGLDIVDAGMPDSEVPGG